MDICWMAGAEGDGKHHAALCEAGRAECVLCVRRGGREGWRCATRVPAAKKKLVATKERSTQMLTESVWNGSFSACFCSG